MKKTISGPILHRYRCYIGVYPFLATTDIGFFADIGSDMYPILQTISQYTDIGANFQRHRFLCVINITIYRYPGFTILGRITRYRGRRRRCRTGTGTALVWQQLPAGGRAGRRRATAQALQQAQPLDPRHAQTFCRPGGLPSIHRAAAAQATKLEKFETFNDINVPLS